jgi:hypothetical protein
LVDAGILIVASVLGVLALGPLTVINSVRPRRAHHRCSGHGGLGPLRCSQTTGAAIELEKVEDLKDIMSCGGMSTPGDVIDGAFR